MDLFSHTANAGKCPGSDGWMDETSSWTEREALGGFARLYVNKSDEKYHTLKLKWE